MFHPNDTLNGRLHRFERDDEKHLRGKLGYWRTVEKRLIREELAREGVEPTEFAVSSRIRENHANDISYREYQKTVLMPRWAAQAQARFEAGETERDGFTLPEWELILERFAGSNTPEGQAIAEKAMSALARREQAA